MHDASKKLSFSDKYFDLVISLGTLRLEIAELKSSIQEIQRLGKNKYIMVESYRNEEELFNLQCWALTCRHFIHMMNGFGCIKNLVTLETSNLFIFNDHRYSWLHRFCRKTYF